MATKRKAKAPKGDTSGNQMSGHKKHRMAATTSVKKKKK